MTHQALLRKNVELTLDTREQRAFEVGLAQTLVSGARRGRGEYFLGIRLP